VLALTLLSHAETAAGEATHPEVERELQEGEQHHCAIVRSEESSFTTGRTEASWLRLEAVEESSDEGEEESLGTEAAEPCG
jgi:hypothetical protein